MQFNVESIITEGDRYGDYKQVNAFNKFQLIVVVVSLNKPCRD